MADYLYSIEPDSWDPGHFKFAVYRCTPFGVQRIVLPSARARTKVTAWAKARWYIAVLRHQERARRETPIRR